MVRFNSVILFVFYLSQLFFFSFFFFFFKGIPLFLFIFIYLFLAVLGLRFCARAFSSCGKRGPLFIVVRGPLTITASLVVEHRLQTRRLSSCGSRAKCSAACGIFPDQGSNPCPLHSQADSQQLRHQGSPLSFLLKNLFHQSLCISCLTSAALTLFAILCFLKYSGF